MDIKETLRKLTSLEGVSGDELRVSRELCSILYELDLEPSVDPFGNVTVFIESDWANAPTVMLDAHLDRIGMVVTNIDEQGFLGVGAVGGLDMRTMPAQSVTVWGSEPLHGVISALPPHVTSDRTKVPAIDEIAVDVGLSAEQARAAVSLGDRVTVDGEFREMCGLISAPCLDNRSGVCVVLRALELLGDSAPSKNVAVCFSSQEETGERGAKQAAFRIAPDEAICVDVSFGRTPDSVPHETAALGSGVMIGFSAALDRWMSNSLCALAEDSGIPYTREVMPSATGTNADSIGISGKGVRCGTLSVPIRYMHTAVETVDPADIEAAARLIWEYIK